jgi:hypothetical protein
MDEKHRGEDCRFWLANGNRRTEWKAYALVSRFLPGQSCDELISKYNNSDLYRKTSRHRFGLGEYKQVTITEIIWQNGKALEILRIEIKSAEQ